MQYLSFCVQLISLNMMSSSCNHFDAHDRMHPSIRFFLKTAHQTHSLFQGLLGIRDCKRMMWGKHLHWHPGPCRSSPHWGLDHRSEPFTWKPVGRLLLGLWPTPQTDKAEGPAGGVQLQVLWVALSTSSTATSKARLEVADILIQ